MNKFKDIIKNFNKNKGIIYKNNIEIINENKKDEYYIDSRTEREENKADELNIVYAFSNNVLLLKSKVAIYSQSA